MPVEFGESYENSLVDQLPERMVLQKPAVIAGIMERIFRDHLSGGELAYFRAKASLYQLFSELFAEVAALRTSGSTLQVRKSIAFIRENLTGPLQVEKLIEESGLSRSAFHRQFKQETGMTPGQFLSFLRIDQAKRLLSTTDMEIGEVAASCGFSDSNYFSRVFRRSTGLTPTAFRQGV